ncbi:MAG: hypothetical protein BJ554DRAFT_4667 [Olpidium bornovanus]|uniref:Uncharacterized protein n=1 Tax=Olpidium bornovanus TaxID=278681 RepID=A0A8H8DLS8_9FUNG|nr:MAG: hypothetical protein BJ554DRAFT_4667 [Olpidium bornovanus]
MNSVIIPYVDKFYAKTAREFHSFCMLSFPLINDATAFRGTRKPHLVYFHCVDERSVPFENIPELERRVSQGDLVNIDHEVVTTTCELPFFPFSARDPNPCPNSRAKTPGRRRSRSVALGSPT